MVGGVWLWASPLSKYDKLAYLLTFDTYVIIKMHSISLSSQVFSLISQYLNTCIKISGSHALILGFSIVHHV